MQTETRFSDINVLQTIWFNFNHFDVIGPKSAELGEITRNNGHIITRFTVIQDDLFRYMQLSTYA